MNKVVRRRGTNIYLKADGAWTDFAAHAQVFPSFLQAIDRINQLCLADCEVVFLAGDERFDLILPVSPSKEVSPFSMAAVHALETL